MTNVTIALTVGVLVVNTLIVGMVAQEAFDGDIGLQTVAIVIPALLVAPFVGSIHYDDFTLEFTLAALPRLDRLEADLAAPGLADGERSSEAMPREEIALHGVAFTYPGSSEPVYESLDLVVPAGRSTAIVGANGAGKTTLVKLLARLHEPDGGTITVDGVDLRALRAAEWQRRVAVVFQDLTRFPLSARENIALGAVGHADDTVGIEEAARSAGALDVIAALPGGWDTILSRSYTGGTDLSGGQWQRIALARALFAARHGATVLVLDEPTAHLDIRAEAAFYGRFLCAPRGPGRRAGDPRRAPRARRVLRPHVPPPGGRVHRRGRRRRGRSR
jgi:ATP-binding cassette, subfamily B, bacterial